MEKFARWATAMAGSSTAFALASLVILVWMVSGPIFHYADTWQLFINTGTTIVTFLMVFVIQRSQNKEALATQLKLNEIVASINGASNRLINIEDLSEHEVERLHCVYKHLAQRDPKRAAAHSIEEAGERARKNLGEDT